MALPFAKREKVFSGRKNALETLFPSSPPSPRTTALRACAAVLAAFVTRMPIFEGVGVHFCQILAAQRGIFQGRSPLWPYYGRASPIDVEARLHRERRDAWSVERTPARASSSTVHFSGGLCSRKSTIPCAREPIYGCLFSESSGWLHSG